MTKPKGGMKSENTAVFAGSDNTPGTESSSVKPAVNPSLNIPPLDSQSSEYEHILSFDRDNLIRGIIFAEILGKPKGKRGRW